MDTMNNESKEELSNIVKEYLSIDNELKKLSIAVKERKIKQKKLSELILTNMKSNDIHHINIKNGVLIYKEKESFKGLNKTTLQSGLSIVFNNDEDKVSDASKTILDSRPRITKISLQHKKF